MMQHDQPMISARLMVLDGVELLNYNKKSWRLIMKVISVLVVVMLSGCASFRAYEQPIVKPEQITTNFPRKLLVNVKWKAVPDRYHSPSEMVTAENKQSSFFYEELVKSGCCELASSGQAPDIVIDAEVDVSYKADGFLEGLLRIPTQFTFAIIPGWDNYHYKVKVSVRNSKGSYREYSATDSGLLIQWLPMAPFFMLGESPKNVDEDLLRNLHRNIIYRMKRDGFMVGWK